MEGWLCWSEAHDWKLCARLKKLNIYLSGDNTERWLSWSKAHDWKSCRPLKGLEGSNPSLSAKKKSL